MFVPQFLNQQKHTLPIIFHLDQFSTRNTPRSFEKASHAAQTLSISSYSQLSENRFKSFPSDSPYKYMTIILILHKHYPFKNTFPLFVKSLVL